MGTIRNGARTFLRVLHHACKLSHLPGFMGGLSQILGDETRASFELVWTPLCNFVDALVEVDNWYNQKDHVNDDGSGEDATPFG